MELKELEKEKESLKESYYSILETIEVLETDKEIIEENLTEIYKEIAKLKNSRWEIYSNKGWRKPYEHEQDYKVDLTKLNYNYADDYEYYLAKTDIYKYDVLWRKKVYDYESKIY